MKRLKGLEVMQALKYIEDSFNSFALRTKIGLFFIPFLIFLLLIYLIIRPKLNEHDSSKKIDSKIILEQMQALKMQDELVNIIRDVEKYADKNFLKIDSISSQNKSIKLDFFANKKEQIRFIKYLEDYNEFSKIKTLLIDKKRVSLELDFEKFYFKKKAKFRKKSSKTRRKKRDKIKATCNS